MAKIVFAIIFSLVLVAGCTKPANFPYMDSTLPLEVRVADLTDRLTIAEKISLLHVTSPSIPHLHIDAYNYGNEALHGIVRRNGPATVFPQAIGLAATWNPELIEQVAVAISDEARAKRNAAGGKLSGGEEFGGQFNGLLTFFSPTINMARDPRWGRTSETYGEDPYLTSGIAHAFIRGMQGDHPKYLKTICTPKHFVANNEEHNRFTNNVVVSEKTLREYYLAAFRHTVMKSGAGSIMAAYNAINGTPCNANKWLLDTVLRQEWGFDGYVVADCGAIKHLYESHQFSANSVDAVADALQAGVDLECGGKQDYYTSLPIALEQGKIDENDIDRAVSAILRGRFRLGMFDSPAENPYNKIDPNVVGSEQHVGLALQTARESIVLLKNDGILPIDFTTCKKILVLGPNANTCQFGERNYSGIPLNPPVTPLEGFKNVFPERVEIIHIPWHTKVVEGTYTLLTEENIVHPEIPNISGFKSFYFHNDKLKGEPVYSRIDPELNFDWNSQAPDPFYNYNGFSVRSTGILIPPKSGTYSFRVQYSGTVKITLDENVFSSEEKVSGYLHFDVELDATKSYPISLGYLQNNVNNPAVRVEWRLNGTQATSPILSDYAHEATDSDLIICCMGLSSNSAVESIDRETLSLPEDQLALLRELFKINQRIVLILINGNPLEVQWADKNIPAITEAWFPGEQGGTAIAEIVSGKINPSGKLPLTFYTSIDQLTPFDDYEISNGKTYMYLKTKPLYPFGHGLSYTEFSMNAMEINSGNFTINDTIELSLQVTNTGKYDGSEVVQLYVRHNDDEPATPLKKLYRFEKVYIKKDSAALVNFSIPVKELEIFNEQAGHFAVKPGSYTLMVGSSSEKIKKTKTININQLIK